MDAANATTNGKRKADAVDGNKSAFTDATTAPPAKKATTAKKKSRPTDSAKVQARLEANRKAARESRRRKKVLVEELQRSVIFFSRANGQLKQKNEELERMFIQAQAQIAARNGTVAAPAAEATQNVDETTDEPNKSEGDEGPPKAEPDGGNDTADATGEENTSDAPSEPQQPQQPEVAGVPFPSAVQQPIPFTAVPGAPAMDPSTMMYMMMMMSGNPLANPMLAANPMMALQMFNQLSAAGAMAGAPTAAGTASTTSTAPAAAAPAAFRGMTAGNVVMPTPGGAFNPFLGGSVPQASSDVAPTATDATNTADAAEGDSSTPALPAAAVNEESTDI